jgi:hypothetical protein
MYTLLATIPEFRRHAAIGNWRRALPVLGPGYLVAVGYVDPGNWATDIAAGAKFGYALLFVVAMSSIVAAFLQMLTVRLALATGTDDDPRQAAGAAGADLLGRRGVGDGGDRPCRIARRGGGAAYAVRAGDTLGHGA